MSDSVATTSSIEAADRTSDRSWLHGAVASFERLPGPTWVAYLALYLADTLFWHLLPWSQGRVPVGTIDPPSLYWGLLLPAILWIAGYLERSAAASFNAFRPILTVPSADQERLYRAMTGVPARPGLVITAIAALLTLGAVLSEPTTYTVGVPLPLTVVAFAIQTVQASILFQLLYWLVSQMTLVRRTLAHSVAIDIFRPGPLHAFATLTARPGIIITLLVGLGVAVTPNPANVEAFLVATAPYLVIPPIIAIIAFVVPLTGAHARLADQKEQLQDDAERRLQAMLGDLNRNVDARDLGQADGLNKTLASLVLQREILSKLPTWPWSTATLRTFVSAMLLPMALFLAQQALSRLF